ncbi:MAG: diacylglycerol kinase family protein, partial [Thermoanaerobaculia bacterium]
MPDRKTKGVMFLNPSSGLRMPSGELSAFEQAAVDAGLEVVRVNPDLDSAALIRQRMEEGTPLFVAAGGDGTI